MLIRRKSKKRKFIFGIIIGVSAAVVVSLILAITMFLMAMYKPAEYLPQPVSLVQQEQAVDQAISLVADIHNSVYASESFTKTIPASLLNKLLLHEDLNKLLEREFQNTTFSISHPQVSLRDGLLIIYVTMDYDRYNAVVSIALSPQIESNGNLAIKLSSIKSGKLALPKAIITDHLVQAADKIKMYVDNISPGVHDNDKKTVELEIARFIGLALPQLLKEGSFEVNPIINTSDNDNHIRLNEIILEDQILTLSFSNEK